MIDLSSKLGKKGGGAEINMAPLIDMVFLLLIFFLVTTSFSRETGVEVKRPKAVSASELGSNSILVSITRDGRIFMHNRRVALAEMATLVREQLRSDRMRPVVIIADKGSDTGTLIDVMDECGLAGARNVSIAAAAEKGK